MSQYLQLTFPLDNPAKVRYCSLDTDLADPLNLAMDCFQLLEIRKAKKQKFAGGILAFPPAIHIISFNKYLAELKLEPDTEVYYLLPASYVARTFNMLVGVAEIIIEEFCGKNNMSFLRDGELESQNSNS